MHSLNRRVGAGRAAFGSCYSSECSEVATGYAVIPGRVADANPD